MMFSRNDVRVIVSMMMGMDIPEEEFVMDEMNASAIREVMNQMMGSSATALSEFLGTTVDISTPVSFEIPNEKEFKEKKKDKNSCRRGKAICGQQLHARSSFGQYPEDRDTCFYLA